MMIERGSSGIRGMYVAAVLATALLLLTARGTGGSGEGAWTKAPFFMSDSQGPSFSLGWMPGFEDSVPDIEPVNLTLTPVVGVADPDGMDSVSYLLSFERSVESQRVR